MNIFQEAKQILDKDGKVNALGPYGKQKLTGSEVAQYFRKNKVSDSKIKKAVEVALDLGGAMDIARKEIKKFYGDKILKSKEVQNALRFANEEVIGEGKGSDIFKKYGSLINRLSDKEKDEVIELLYTMNTQSGRRYKEAFGKVKELLNMEYIPEDSDMEDINENYRTLAQKGMGTESEKDARVGLELDFYDSKGNKQFGKIVKKDRKGYTVKDKKGKMHTFTFLDRQKAKKLLVKTDKLSNIIKKNTIKKGKFAGYMTDEVNIDEGAFSVKLNKPYKRGDEKMYMDIIKKYGGKNLKVSPPKGRDLELDITFDGGDVKKIKANLPNKGKGSEWISEEVINEKIEYVEYKFKNKNDAQKALDYFKRINLMKLNINDDSIRMGELAVDAGNKDMTKYHKEVMKKFKPKVQVQEKSAAQQAAIAIAKKEKGEKPKNESVMDSYRKMWENSIEENNMERKIMSKMRKGRVAKGMPR